MKEAIEDRLKLNPNISLQEFYEEMFKESERAETDYFIGIIGKCFKYKYNTMIPYTEYIKVDTYIPKNSSDNCLKLYTLDGALLRPVSCSNIFVDREYILKFEEISEEEYNSVVDLYKETYEKVLKLLNK